MHRRQDPPAELLALAGCQAGVLSAEQIAGFGLPPNAVARLVREGRWRRLTKGLYLVVDTQPPWLARAWGGVLLGGDNARLGGASAIHLWGLADPPPVVTVLVPHDHQVVDRDSWEFRRERRRTPDRRSVGDPPRLIVEQALLDLCDELEPHEVIDLVFRAVQKRRTVPRGLAAALERRPRARHRRLILELLADAAAGAETPLEHRFLIDVERAHGLPAGRRQARTAGGRFQDVRYDRYALVVELDGRIGHEGVGRFRDMDRDNRAVVLGEATLRYGWPDVIGRACQVALQVAGMLIRGGWDDLPHRCPSCRDVPDHDWVN